MSWLRLLSIICASTLLLTACVNPQTELRRGQLSFQEQNYHDAFIRLTPLAKNGNARAQYAIGYMYFYGQGITENHERGIFWMQRAARQGQPQAVAALKMLLITSSNDQTTIKRDESLM